MVLDYKTIDLFGKMLFEKAIIQAPFQRPNPMHNEACFLYIIDGECQSVSEEEAIRIPEGESVLMKCGNYLAQMFSNKEDGRYEAIAVHFYPEILTKIYGNELPTILKKQDHNFRSNMVKLKASILVQKYIDSLLFYFENPQLVTEEILVLKLKEIILLLLQTENAPSVIEILSNLFSKRTFSFKEVIEAHICSDISIADLAQLTNHSLSSFKRVFKKIYQDTPGSYLKNRRLEKSADLLAVSETTVSHIAYDCGFKDIAHFSKSFKKKYGMTPSDYRLTLKDKKLNLS